MHKAAERSRQTLETSPFKTRKKNRLKWCRGKLGVEHKPRWKIWTQMQSIYRKKPENVPLVFSCDVCGKHIEHWFSYWDAKPRPQLGSAIL